MIWSAARLLYLLCVLQVTGWLNDAMLCQSVSEKLELLHKAEEFLIHKSPELLPELLNDFLSFATDRSQEVKVCVVGFIEEAW